MPLARAEPHSTAELRQLIATLEGSGLAERRADVRTLLAHSHAVLAAAGARPPPSAGKAWRKLRAVGGLLLDVGCVAIASFAAIAAMLGRGGWVAALLLLACAGWAVLRAQSLRQGLAEAPYLASYLAGWAWDWVAEAFSDAATQRLHRRLAAWDIMADWRHHRRSLPRAAVTGASGLAALRSFLAQAHGAARFSALDGALDARLEALRWAALMQAFARVTAAPAIALPEPAPPPPVPAGPPEAVARRIDLREAIRRKRAEVTTAYGGKLKTPAENDHREQHVNGLKADIAALESQLATLG